MGCNGTRLKLNEKSSGLLTALGKVAARVYMNIALLCISAGEEEGGDEEREGRKRGRCSSNQTMFAVGQLSFLGGEMCAHQS